MHQTSRSRDPFIEWLDTFGVRPPTDSPEGRAMLGALWNCTDILPVEHCRQLEIPTGSTYAQAAQELLRFWKAKSAS